MVSVLDHTRSSARGFMTYPRGGGGRQQKSAQSRAGPRLNGYTFRGTPRRYDILSLLDTSHVVCAVKRRNT